MPNIVDKRKALRLVEQIAAKYPFRTSFHAYVKYRGRKPECIIGQILSDLGVPIAYLREYRYNRIDSPEFSRGT